MVQKILLTVEIDDSALDSAQAKADKLIATLAEIEQRLAKPAEIRQIVREELDKRDRRLTESLEQCAPTGKEFFQELHKAVADSKPIQDLKELCRPVVECIQRKYGSPHHRIIIDWCSAPCN